MGKKLLVETDRLIEVVTELKRTGLKITQKAVARRLHVGEDWFLRQLQDEEFRRFYEALVRDST